MKFTQNTIWDTSSNINLSQNTISWTTPSTVVNAGIAQPYEFIVADSCSSIKRLHTIGVNNINPRCGRCPCNDTLNIFGNVVDIDKYTTWAKNNNAFLFFSGGLAGYSKNNS